MSEEKLVPKLRFSGFNDEWKSFKLNEVGNIVTGATPPTKDNDNFINSGYLWVTPGDISSKKFVSKTERNLSEKGLKNGRKLDPNSILVTCIGATIGKLCMINEIGSCNQQLNAISANKNFYPDFIYYVIQKTAKNLILIAGNTATPILNKKSFGNLSYIFPSFNEQKKIALFLDKIDKKRELLEKKYEFYQDFKKYLMQQIFTQKLRFADYNEYSLKQILEKIENGFSGTQVNYETPFPVTRIETISSGIINYNKVGFVDHIPERYLLKEGDILLTNINSIKWIGNSVYFDGKRVLYHGMNLMLLRSKKEINSKYLYYYITYNNNWFKKMACQAVNQASINKSTLEKFIVKIPDFETQNNIANVLSLTDEKINRISNQVDLTRKFKKGLLQQMFV